MKTMTNLAKALLIATLFAVAPNAFGQSIEENNPQEKYRIKIVRDEKSKKEVVDKTFQSKEEMDAFIKENNIKVEELPVLSYKDQEKKCSKEEMNLCTKMVFIEKDENTGSKKRKSLHSGKEEVNMNTTIIIKNGAPANIQEMTEWESATEAAAPGEPSGGKPVQPSLRDQPGKIYIALSELSLYPNPSGGNFHISFRTEQPADVTLRMTDMTGKQVYFNIVRNHQGLFEKDIFFAGGLPKGTYLMEAAAGDQRVTTRVVVQ